MLNTENVTRCLLKNQLPLTAFICTLTHSYHLAEDVFQDVCMKALHAEMQFESEEHLVNWARVTARNRAIDSMRALHGKFECLSDTTLERIASIIHGSYSSQNQKQDALMECLKTLTASSREILRLRYFEGMSSSMVAKTINRKVTTVYQSITRIHHALSSCIEKRIAQTESTI